MPSVGWGTHDSHDGGLTSRGSAQFQMAVWIDALVDPTEGICPIGITAPEPRADVKVKGVGIAGGSDGLQDIIEFVNNSGEFVEGGGDASEVGGVVLGGVIVDIVEDDGEGLDTMQFDVGAA